jgi:CDP-diacylglycerol--serine O-phosphatidyltransferase
MMKQIPNLFTLLNLIFGCLAIVAVLQNGISIQYDPEGTQLVNIPEKVWMASVFIGAAALVDFLDGFVARLFNASSELGKQLDSLADVVSFGVAPSMILYQFLRLSYARQEDGLDVAVIWLLPAFIVAAASAYRLGKFNLDASQQYGFKGVPTPAVGLLLASLPMIYWFHTEAWVIGLLLNKWFLYGIIVVVSWLMVSNLPLMALKFRSSSLSDNWPKIALLVISVICILLLQWLSVPVIFIAYILLSLVIKKQRS